MRLKELRIKLDQMTERIISRLKDRSRYKLNEKVYQKDALPIKDKSGISFFEFSLEGLEKYHASLGRYNFPDQHPLFVSKSQSRIKREVPSILSIKKIKINIGKEVIQYYLNSLKKFCPRGDDPSTYGETVYCDADIVELLNERINLGRYVARFKARNKPSVLDVKNEDQLKRMLRDPERENDVITKARKIAQRYNFPPDIAGEYFRWIIRKTLEVEAEYLKKVHKIFPEK